MPLLSGKRFLKTRISSKQYKYLCETFRLSLNSKKSKNTPVICCKKKKEHPKYVDFFLYSPVVNYGHIYKAIDL